MSASVGLPAEFQITHWERLPAEFEVRQSGASELPAQFLVRNVGFAQLPAQLGVAHWERLPAQFEVGQGAVALPAEFHVGQDSAALLSEFVVRQAASVELLGEFIVRQAAFVQLLSIFTVRHTTSLDGPLGVFTVRHSDLEEFPAEFVVRHSAATEWLSEFIVRHSAAEEFLGLIDVVHWKRLDAEFIVRHTTYITGPKGVFWVRFPIRLWTNRRYINGVISLKEMDLQDAILEYVIEGVMEDVQGILEVNEVVYDTWTDLTLVPTLIRRATTYGTVASLYARHTKTFSSRVIPSISPVTVTVIGDEEKAMRFWEDRMNRAIAHYLTTVATPLLLTSTEDEEAIFSMEDIPSDLRELASWHEWLGQRNT